MTFISYAQNLEDVMLWRALRDVQNGFYIDAGAFDPHEHSVTKAFYERRWRGINIEPVRQYHDNFCQYRIEDLNLNVAVGKSEGMLPFFHVLNTGLSTFDAKIALNHQDHGFANNESSITVTTLAKICSDYIHQDINFLKIDIEGAEKDALLGMDFKKYRPWIVVVEATQPLSQQEDYTEWEHILLTQQYQFVYFDGLNRFYLADEHSNLAQRFNAPPNVFDEYIKYSEIEKQQKIEVLQREKLAILKSTSWKVTKPLRKIGAFLKKIKNGF